MFRLFCVMFALTTVPAMNSAAADQLQHSGIVPSLDFPADTLQICDGLRAGPIANPKGDCWEAGKEHWMMRRSYGATQDWVTAQMAELGQQPYSTYGDGPSVSWGRGTRYRVTVEVRDIDQAADVYVSDVNSINGAHQ